MLWLLRRLVATAPIRPLAWEPPYATGVALEKAKNVNNNKGLSYLTSEKKTFYFFILFFLNEKKNLLKVGSSSNSRGF